MYVMIDGQQPFVVCLKECMLKLVYVLVSKV